MAEFKRKFFRVLIFAIVCGLFVPAGAEAKSSKTTITISKKTLTPNETTKIKIKSAKKNWRVKVASSNKKVISVPKTKVLKKSSLTLSVKAKKSGSTKLTVTVQKKTNHKWKQVAKKSFKVKVKKDAGNSGQWEETLPVIGAGEKAKGLSQYKDSAGDIAVIPKDFTVSKTENRISKGLVVTGPDGSEFVWIPTTVTPLSVREFGSYFSGGTVSEYHDETNLTAYKEMKASVDKYGGFYMGRYEASHKEASNIPASKRITGDDEGKIWVRYSPKDTTAACRRLYSDNDTVQGFFPWGINWDTTLQWLIDSGNKTSKQVKKDSTSWGNYSNDTFSANANGVYTGKWKQTKANNIYDLAGNNWEWTQERCGSDYVMRGGGYNLMGGACPGSEYPAAIRDPLPGNDHHPNVTFRVALHIK